MTVFLKWRRNVTHMCVSVLAVKSACLTVLENRDHAALERFRNVGLSSVSRYSNWNQTSSNIGLVKI